MDENMNNDAMPQNDDQNMNNDEGMMNNDGDMDNNDSMPNEGDNTEMGGEGESMPEMPAEGEEEGGDMNTGGDDMGMDNAA